MVQLTRSLFNSSSENLERLLGRESRLRRRSNRPQLLAQQRENCQCLGQPGNRAITYFQLKRFLGESRADTRSLRGLNRIPVPGQRSSWNADLAFLDTFSFLARRLSRRARSVYRSAGNVHSILACDRSSSVHQRAQYNTVAARVCAS